MCCQPGNRHGLPVSETHRPRRYSIRIQPRWNHARSAARPQRLVSRTGLEGKKISSPSSRRRKTSLTCPLIDPAITLRRKSSPDLNNRLGNKLVYGGNSDLIAELTKGSRQHLGTLFLFSRTYFVALLDESHPFMQDLPNDATEPMGNGPDGGLVAEAGHQTAEHNLKMTAFLGDRSVRGLVQHAT